MGLYATLNSATVPCPVCGEPCTDDWQFYFGAVSDLPSYRTGDSIVWKHGACFGQPSMNVVDALAYNVREPACTSCGTVSIIAELVIRDGVIEELRKPRAASHVEELLYEGEQRQPRYHADLYRIVSDSPSWD